MASVAVKSQEPRTKVETFAKLSAGLVSFAAHPSYAFAMGMIADAAATVVASPATVLVVDDEPMVREVLVRYLELDGLRVHEAADGDEAVAWLARHEPDLVVLDIMLPGKDGLTILRRIRAASNVPVILLTARAEEADRVVGLELGADDYVVKPFSPREVAARARTVLRRTHAGAHGSMRDQGALQFEGLHIDPRTREVVVDGQLASLTAKEFDLLYALASSPRQVFSRRQLLAQVWDSSPEYQDPATVTVHIGRLRQKIEADPDTPRWITTTRGIGYRFES